MAIRPVSLSGVPSLFCPFFAALTTSRSPTATGEKRRGTAGRIAHRQTVAPQSLGSVEGLISRADQVDGRLLAPENAADTHPHRNLPCIDCNRVTGDRHPDSLKSAARLILTCSQDDNEKLFPSESTENVIRP